MIIRIDMTFRANPLKSLQVGFGNEIKFIIVNNFSKTLDKVTHRIRMFRFQHCLHETG